MVSIADLEMRPAKQPLRDAAALCPRYIEMRGLAMLVIGLAHEVMRIYAGDMDTEVQPALRRGSAIKARLISAAVGDHGISETCVDRQI